MLYISDNLKYLRGSRKLSQQEAADGMKMPLDRYKKYEYGKNTPPAETLLVISRFYHISIDLLLTVDLRKTPPDKLLRLDDNRIVFPIAVDSQGDNLIEIVPHKARAGYLTGYADPEFIEGLQQISLPFLGPGKFRAFPIGGDSMPPHNEKAFIVGRYVENLGEVSSGKTYILVTRSEGITYKRLSGKSKNALTVESDNLIYSPYAIKLSDIIEIWEYTAHIGRDDEKPTSEDDSVKTILLELKREVSELKRTVGKT